MTVSERIPRARGFEHLGSCCSRPAAPSRRRPLDLGDIDALLARGAAVAGELGAAAA